MAETTTKAYVDAAVAAAIAASQPLDSDLTAIAALTTTAFGRALLALANEAAVRAIVGGLSVGTGPVLNELMGSLHTAVGAVLPGNGTLYLSPVIYERTTTIDRLYCNVTIAGDTTSVFRMGLYPDAGGTPDLTYDPVANGTDYGTVATTGTGLFFVAAAKTLTPGRWWHAGVQQGLPTTRATYSMNTPPATQTNPIATPTTVASSGRYKTGVTGALPVLGSLAALDNANIIRIWSRPTA